jgi:hypothetical protein
MLGAERWKSNWRVVSPAGGMRIELPRSRGALREAERRIRELPAGTPVVLAAAAPGASGRCRGVAARTGVVVERRYLAFPSLAAAGYLVEERRAPIGFFLRSVLVAPPGTRLSGLIGACLAVLRALAPWRVVRALAPGRIAVGRRT